MHLKHHIQSKFQHKACDFLQYFKFNLFFQIDLVPWKLNWNKFQLIFRSIEHAENIYAFREHRTYSIRFRWIQKLTYCVWTLAPNFWRTCNCDISCIFIIIDNVLKISICKLSTFIRTPFVWHTKMDDPIFKTKYHKYKTKVKLWEKSFKELNGRVPSKVNIFRNSADIYFMCNVWIV